jgi:hypothetical protein
MAERRPEDSGPATRGQEGVSDRVTAAYGSSASTQSDSSQGVASRFAAVLGGGSSTKDKTATERTVREKTPSTRRVRKAHLRVTHVDPWSVMKVSFLFSIAVGIVFVVAVGVVWGVLGAAGIWDSIDSTVADVVGETGKDFRIEDYLGTSRVMGFTMIVAVVDVVLVTVIGTLTAFLYNLAAALLGGVEVVLAEDEV